MTTFTDEVREATGSGHKFSSRRAAAAWLVSLDGCLDEQTGSVEYSCGWMGRIGRTILEEDDRGFVTCSTFAKESDAIAVFNATDEEYGRALDAEEEEREAWNDGYRPDVNPDEGSFSRGWYVRVDGHPGIAWRVTGYPTRRLSDYEWSGIEWSKIAWRTVVMVGDDREHEFCVFDLHYLREEEFCSTCGQIGCPWH